MHMFVHKNGIVWTWLTNASEKERYIVYRYLSGEPRGRGEVAFFSASVTTVAIWLIARYDPSTTLYARDLGLMGYVITGVALFLWLRGTMIVAHWVHTKLRNRDERYVQELVRAGRIWEFDPMSESFTDRAGRVLSFTLYKATSHPIDEICESNASLIDTYLDHVAVQKLSSLLPLGPAASFRSTLEEKALTETVNSLASETVKKIADQDDRVSVSV